MQKIAIIGTTSWGITLGILLANKGLEVRLWARTYLYLVKLESENRVGRISESAV